MRKPKLVLSFVRLSIWEKIAYYRNVVAKMKDNTLFPTPDVPIADAEKKLDEFETAAQKARDGSTADTALMHQTEEETDAIFRKLAAYVERIADGDEAIILQAGFTLSKDPSPRKQPILMVEDGAMSGSVRLRRKAVTGSRSYIWQIIVGALPASEKDWVTLGVSTQVEYIAENLTIGTRYYFRSAAVTKDGTSAFCEPVSRIVQ
ncbi:fibronectin type III domain-containing protein [Microbacter margulisiae]|uniref:Fibronectin type-III domain-containing protein n=1 Tax=Microbacter margulisiae TaxID=1350067 RepID=A0A7W5DQX9_9PORP|nr:fibronectin type III domain-containing protein [Microbacter margulisiae]MBB3186643.1 hypothetical protein [Microbacter margulisiae]